MIIIISFDFSGHFKMQSLQARERTYICQYTRLDSDESDTEEQSCRAWHTQNEWKDGNHALTIFSGKPEIHESLQVNGSRTPIKPSQLGLLQIGDHIGWRRDYMIWHHAIVVDIDVENRELSVIHRTKVSSKYQIVEQKINIDKENGDLFRFDYADEIINRNPPEEVVERAREKVGEPGYNLLKKNCEHFATECKTGTGYCVQVKWAWGKTKEALHAGAGNFAKAGTRLGCAVAKEVSKQTGKSVTESSAKVGVAEMAEGISIGSNWVGAGLVADIEIAHGAYDICHIHKKYKAGEMTKRDFQVTTTQRVSEGVVGGGLAIGASIGGEALGGLTGGAIGTLIAPGPGTAIGAAVGDFIGSVFAGAVGSILGKALGSLFGRWLGKTLW